MLGKRTHLGKLSELFVSGNRARVVSEATTSPRCPLYLKAQSPRCGTKCYELGGVGLGIVAALEKPSSSNGKGHEILAKYAITSPRCSIKSAPIPAYSGRNCGGFEEEIDLENYTYVTFHGPDNKSITKVYHDGGDNARIDNVCEAKKTKKKTRRFNQNSYPVSDFLSSCHLCQKQLHGKDIYMYRGEKAFCSPECRSRQIMVDERKEQCRSSDAARSADLSSSPYTRDQIFSTGILAI
ncbi:hypothetical protein HS088_TW09G01180 [Tripterygium wilfordii]|uniref:FLZ-type domain-containing protein n=1 Tax=Tripterygium wilfordii TaxID=458696 RepID=A0A7J7D9S2_TRIWF|nr:FCS-Like Zinc finger 13-like [Tripterygium wilfordii]KAF5743115.1 hypothetical protein HS088_TW09G01180 [Tripterygium wilfordii]